MKAMIFAAGLGTRLKNETSDKPKALVDIGGRPLLQYSIEKLISEGFSEIVVNVHHYSSLIVEWIHSHSFQVPVYISDETELLLETGGGLKKASSFLNGDTSFLVYNVDIISNLNFQSLLQDHLESGALATLVVRKRETQRYLKFDGNRRLVGWINKKSGETKISIPENFEGSSEMAFSGIHIVSPEIFKLMPDKERFSMIDLYLDLARTNLIKGYFDQSELWMDVGKPEELERIRKLFINTSRDSFIK